MITLHKILCPIDFSGHSRVALDYATALARWYEAEIVALHAYSVAMVPATIGGYAATSVGIPITREEVEHDLEHFVEPARSAAVKTTQTVAAGNPAQAILDAARKLPADMIVMGTHGASGFERWLIGSVTEKVLRKAACPVLVVPRRADAPGGAPILFRRVLCAVDFSPCSEKAVTYALSLAEEAGGALTFIHVIEGFDEEPAVYAHFRIPEYRQHLEALATARLQKLIPPETSTWCDCSTEIRAGKAYREIVTVANERGADLIVLGVRGRNPVDLMLFGSTTNHVVRTADCPVLTVRS